MSIKGTTDIFKYELIVQKKNDLVTWNLHINGTEAVTLCSSDGDQEFTNDDISFKCRHSGDRILFGVVSTPDKRHADLDWFDVEDLYRFSENYWRFKSELVWGYCWLKMV